MMYVNAFFLLLNALLFFIIIEYSSGEIIGEISASKNNVAYISAILGNYEKTSKPLANQTIPISKFLFTDNPNLINLNKWQIINIKNQSFYSPLDNPSFVNSKTNNHHTFNLAKYFKEQFYRIPQLQNYDIIVWLDGTIEITDPTLSQKLINLFESNKELMVASINHTIRKDNLINEVKASYFYRYTSVHWAGQDQPYQNITRQYEYYKNNGFQDVGVWITCFVAWNMRHQSTYKFLDDWFIHNLNFTTQDQISFPYLIWKNNLSKSIYTYPEKQFYRRHSHGN